MTLILKSAMKLSPLFILLALTGCQRSHLKSEPQKEAKITSEVILKSTTSWDGVKYPPYSQGQPELTTLRITIPANTIMDWHYHPVANAAYVQSGILTVEKKPQDNAPAFEKTFYPGQVVPEMINTVHRGKTGSQPVVLIVTYSAIENQPVTVPVGNKEMHKP